MLVVVVIFAVIFTGTLILVDYLLTKCQDKIYRLPSPWNCVWGNFLMCLSVLGCVFLAVAVGAGVIHILIQLC